MGELFIVPHDGEAKIQWSTQWDTVCTCVKNRSQPIVVGVPTGTQTKVGAVDFIIN